LKVSWLQEYRQVVSNGDHTAQALQGLTFSGAGDGIGIGLGMLQQQAAAHAQSQSGFPFKQVCQTAFWALLFRSWVLSVQT
jgi:hypothetical protein